MSTSYLTVFYIFFNFYFLKILVQPIGLIPGMAGIPAGIPIPIMFAIGLLLDWSDPGGAFGACGGRGGPDMFAN